MKNQKNNDQFTLVGDVYKGTIRLQGIVLSVQVYNVEKGSLDFAQRQLNAIDPLLANWKTIEKSALAQLCSRFSQLKKHLKKLAPSSLHICVTPSNESAYFSFTIPLEVQLGQEIYAHVTGQMDGSNVNVDIDALM